MVGGAYDRQLAARLDGAGHLDDGGGGDGHVLHIDHEEVEIARRHGFGHVDAARHQPAAQRRGVAGEKVGEPHRTFHQ